MVKGEGESLTPGLTVELVGFKAEVGGVWFKRILGPEDRGGEDH